MSGFIATGPCVACDVVPSFEGKPICRPCVEQVNELRAARNIAPVVIYDDSYSIEQP